MGVLTAYSGTSASSPSAGGPQKGLVLACFYTMILHKFTRTIIQTIPYMNASHFNDVFFFVSVIRYMGIYLC